MKKNKKVEPKYANIETYWMALRYCMNIDNYYDLNIILYYLIKNKENDKLKWLLSETKLYSNSVSDELNNKNEYIKTIIDNKETNISIDNETDKFYNNKISADNSLLPIEWIVLINSIKYSMNRESIYCATFPDDIMDNYYCRLNNNQKKMILQTLIDNLNKHGENAFGNKIIDNYRWLRLLGCLNKKNHYKVKSTFDNTIVTVFDYTHYELNRTEYNETGNTTYIKSMRIVPLESYINNKQRNHIFIPSENIKEIIKNNSNE